MKMTEKQWRDRVRRSKIALDNARKNYNELDRARRPLSSAQSRLIKAICRYEYLTMAIWVPVRESGQ